MQETIEAPTLRDTFTNALFKDDKIAIFSNFSAEEWLTLYNFEDLQPEVNAISKQQLDVVSHVIEFDFYRICLPFHNTIGQFLSGCNSSPDSSDPDEQIQNLEKLYNTIQQIIAVENQLEKYLQLSALLEDVINQDQVIVSFTNPQNEPCFFSDCMLAQECFDKLPTVQDINAVKIASKCFSCAKGHPLVEKIRQPSKSFPPVESKEQRHANSDDMLSNLTEQSIWNNLKSNEASDSSDSQDSLNVFSPCTGQKF